MEDKNVGLSLELLGVSSSSLTGILVSITLILCLLFGFIFIGIEAFAIGGIFSSVINSLIPAGKLYYNHLFSKLIGLGMGAASRGPSKDETIKDEILKDITSKSTKIVGSKEI